MGEYLVELYMGGGDPDAVQESSDRARIAAEDLNQTGTPVRYLRSVFVPEDETCFYLYEATTADDVRAAAHRAGLRFDRVVEAVTEDS